MNKELIKIRKELVEVLSLESKISSSLEICIDNALKVAYINGELSKLREILRDFKLN